MTVCLLPDVGVVLQAQQRMFGVIENTLLDAQFGPRGATDGWLSGGCVFNREAGTDVTNGGCLDVSCNDTTIQKRFNFITASFFPYILKKENLMCINSNFLQLLIPIQEINVMLYHS